MRITEAEFTGLAASLDACPRDGLPEIVFAGRSNVGKSSLINSLTRRKNLARVSQQPGKTRHLLFFKCNQSFYFTDLPGYGYARAPKGEQERFSQLTDHYLNADRPFAAVLLLIDIRHTPTEDDFLMIEYLNAQRYHYGLVLTKADKLSRMQRLNRIREIKVQLQVPDDFPMFAVSNSKQEGIEDLAHYIGEVVDEALSLS